MHDLQSRLTYALIPRLYKSRVAPRSELDPPTLRIKTVTTTWPVAYHYRIFPSERQRLDVAACYLVLAYTGYRPAEVVDGEKSVPTDGNYERLSGSDDSLPLQDKPLDAHSMMITKLLEYETGSRPRSVAFSAPLPPLHRSFNTRLPLQYVTITMSIEQRASNTSTT